MPQFTAQQAFDLALQHHFAGRLPEAEQLYRQILAVYPRHADALHNMGVLARQAGRSDLAVDFLSRSIAIRPDNAEAHSNLGLVLKDLGQLDQAIAACRQAIALRRDYAEAHFNLGIIFKMRGQADQAIAAYRQAIALRPDHFEAFSDMGVALGEIGQPDEAIACFRRAIAINPRFAMGHNNLGVALIEKREFDQAIAACRQAIAIQPNYAEAYTSLGNALKASGEIKNAIAAYRQSLALKPDYPEACNNLGIALEADDQPEAAIAAYQQALVLKPDYADACHGLGNACRASGHLEQAITAYERALVIKPDLVEVMSNLGVTLADVGRQAEAIAVYHRALAIKPDYVEVYNNLAIALRENGQVEQAITACRQALALSPELPAAYSNLADALVDRGDFDAAIAAYRKAISLKANCPDMHTSLVYTLNFLPDCDAQTIAEEHRLWNRLYAKPLAGLIQPHRNDRKTDRRIRVGYVSPDFRGHAVACFLLPLLSAHDRSHFEIFCYAQVSVPDAFTQMVQGLVDRYTSTYGRSDDDVAEMIRRDQIDILVDLAGHTAGNRLLVFARKPAPVQVTYLGYPATTGLETIDYRLTDAFADPPGMTDSLCSEKLVRLPSSAWCYRPLQPPPPVGELPAMKNGWITFGSFNNFCKVNAADLKCWAEVLRQVPGSRLLLKARSLRCESVQRTVRQAMLEMGIESDRLELRGWTDAGDHLAMYGQVDIALDTFPYNGTTTTCEALSMGAAVVTLAGRSHVGRVGVSLLSNLGLAEWVGQTPEEYVRIAVALAGDLPRLQQLRSTLRGRMEQSPLSDGPGLAGNVEAEYRKMWRRWCETEESAGIPKPECPNQ